MTIRPENRQTRADVPTLAQALERIEALERRLMMARAMAMDLAVWIERDRKPGRMRKNAASANHARRRRRIDEFWTIIKPQTERNFMSERNPYERSQWSLTEQSRILKERGLEYSRELARRAGLDPDTDFGLGLWEEGKQPPAVKPYKPPQLDLAALLEARERRFRKNRPYYGVLFGRKPE